MTRLLVEFENLRDVSHTVQVVVDSNEDLQYMAESYARDWRVDADEVTYWTLMVVEDDKATVDEIMADWERESSRQLTEIMSKAGI